MSTNESQTQAAPSPDYTDHSTVTPALSLCPDCGDLHLAFYATAKEAMRVRGADRCAPCVAAHQDELATAERVLRAAARPMLVQAMSGGMNDPRGLTCDECGDVACWYTGSVDPLDGIQETCESCSTKGRISVDQDDEGHVVARFVGGQ